MRAVEIEGIAGRLVTRLCWDSSMITGIVVVQGCLKHFISITSTSVFQDVVVKDCIVFVVVAKVKLPFLSLALNSLFKSVIVNILERERGNLLSQDIFQKIWVIFHTTIYSALHLIHLTKQLQKCIRKCRCPWYFVSASFPLHSL